MVDVRGDGNCFFSGYCSGYFFAGYYLCYNESHHEQIRQSAVNEVIENRYQNFVLRHLMNRFKNCQQIENGQITPQYRQPQTHLVSASK